MSCRMRLPGRLRRIGSDTATRQLPILSSSNPCSTSEIPPIATRVTLPAARTHWRLLLLLTLALLISYIDRGNMATAETVISAQLLLSSKQMGVLLSSFYVTYVLAMIPAGFLAERYGAKP